MKGFFVVLVAVAMSGAEPPAPKYLPGGFGSPSSQYGAPVAQYRNPSDKYGAPSQRRSYEAPSSQYGAPFGADSAQYNAPAAQYGAPSSSNQYAAPSPQYGAPNSFDSTPQMQYSAPVPQYGAPRFSKYASDDQSEPANYNFQYDVQDAEQGNDYNHAEERHEEATRGKYSVVLPDGRRQTVEYTADQDGFKPKISYEEVGSRYGGYKARGGYSNGYSQDGQGYQ